MKYSLFFGFFLFLGPACSKNSGPKPVKGPATSITGYLRYSATAADGVGLFYQVDSASVSQTTTGGDSLLLLSDGKGGYVIDGEDILTRYGRLIAVHTRLAFSLTGKKGCQRGSVPGCFYHPIVDTLGFTPAP